MLIFVKKIMTRPRHRAVWVQLLSWANNVNRRRTKRASWPSFGPPGSVDLMGPIIKWA